MPDDFVVSFRGSSQLTGVRMTWALVLLVWSATAIFLAFVIGKVIKAGNANLSEDEIAGALEGRLTDYVHGLNEREGQN